MLHDSRYGSSGHDRGHAARRQRLVVFWIHNNAGLFDNFDFRCPLGCTINRTDGMCCCYRLTHCEFRLFLLDCCAQSCVSSDSSLGSFALARSALTYGKFRANTPNCGHTHQHARVRLDGKMKEHRLVIPSSSTNARTPPKLSTTTIIYSQSSVHRHRHRHPKTGQF